MARTRPCVGHRIACTLLLATAASADVLVIQANAQLDEIRKAIAPVPIRKGANGQLYVECVVVETPRFGGADTPAFRIVAFTPSRSQRSKPARIPAAQVDVLHEIDTLEDLRAFFGSFGKTLRVGSRRYLQAFLARYRDFSELEFDPSDGICDGAFLTSLVKKKAGRGMDRAAFEAAMKAWTGGGGEYRDAPFSRWTGTPIDMQIAGIVAEVALERRYRYLEAGYEPAAIALLSVLLSAELSPDGPFRTTQERVRLEMTERLNHALDVAAGGSVCDQDPPEVRSLVVQIREEADLARRERLRARLREELAKHAQPKDGMRARWAEQRTALDPSELLDVWLDVHARNPLFAGDREQASDERVVLDLIDRIVRYAATPAEPDPRGMDRIPPWPRMPGLAARLFPPDPEAVWSDRYRARQARLWEQVLARGMPDPASSERSAVLMSAARWGPADEIEMKAQILMQTVVRRASVLQTARDRLARASDERRARREKELARAESEFAGAIALVRLMERMEPVGRTDPGRAIAKQEKLLAERAREIRAEKQAGDPSTPTELAAKELE